MQSKCETCKFRRRAEEKPKSLLALIWRLHTKICPGWKAYQKELALLPQKSSIKKISNGKGSKNSTNKSAAGKSAKRRKR